VPQQRAEPKHHKAGPRSSGVLQYEYLPSFVLVLAAVTALLCHLQHHCLASKARSSRRIGPIDREDTSAADVYAERAKDMEQAEEGQAVLCDSSLPPKKVKVSAITLQDLPPESLAPALKFLDRKAQNRFGETCKRFYDLVTNRTLVLPRWPVSCPFKNLAANDEGLLVKSLVFSKDALRLAVFFKGEEGDGNEMEAPGHLQVWDRYLGQIGDIHCWHTINMKPAFSPDSQWLVLEPDEYSHGDPMGLRICKLPPVGQKGPIIVTHGLLPGHRVRSAAFVDNSTIALVQYGWRVVETFKVAEQTSKQVSLESLGGYGSPNVCGRLAVFLSETKHVFAFPTEFGDENDEEDKKIVVVITDLKQQYHIMAPIPDGAGWVHDLEFSPDGTYLLLAHGQGFSKIDWLENGDIGEAAVIGSLKENQDEFCDISFSPNSSKIVATYSLDADEEEREFSEPSISEIRVIDVRSGKILSQARNDSPWKALVH